jgi:VWFA-related protein
MTQQIKLNLNLFFWVSLILIALPLSNSAQSTKEEKEQIKKFGSSLKKKSDKSGKKKTENNQSEPLDDEIIRIDTNLFVSDFLVLNKQGYAVTGLKKEDFIVSEDEQLQKIEIFSSVDNTALSRSIVLMIDFDGLASGSIETSLDAAKVLIRKLNPKDKVAIVTDEIKLLQPFTEDKERLQKQLDLLKKNQLLTPPNSFQYETLLAILNEMFNETGKTRPIIIAQTQGNTLFLLKQTQANILPPFAESVIKREPKMKSIWENAPRRDLSYDEVYIAAEKSKATIYTIIPTLSLIGYSQEEQTERTVQIIEGNRAFLQNSNWHYKGSEKGSTRIEPPLDEKIFMSQVMLKKQERLASLAKVTGGWVDFLEKPEQADAIYSRIFSDINQRYTVGYYSTNEAKSGKRRTIKLEVKNHPEYRILGRKTYLP